MVKYLRSLGVADLPHAGQTYEQHLTAVYHGLKLWGHNEEVCAAGFFHSIYGTQRFQAFKLPMTERATVIALVGGLAERLAYINCTIEREDLDAFVLEYGSGPLKSDMDRWLYAVHLCDWLDQVPFTKEWGYRREVYKAMAYQLGGEALSAYEWVYRGR